MAYLVQCPVCKHDISNEANNCSYCGDPQHKYVTEKRQHVYGSFQWLKCGQCDGEGRISWTESARNTDNPRSHVSVCSLCTGKGILWGQPCETKTIIHDVRLRK